MKTKILFFTAAFGLLVSCSKSENNETPQTPQTVVGSYALTAFNISVPQDLNGDGIKSVNQMSESSCFNGNLLTLNANNTFSMTDKGVEIVTNGITETLSCFNDPNVTGTWSVTGDIVTLVSAGSSDLFKIGSNTLTQSIANGQVVSQTPNSIVYVTSNIDRVYTKQ